MSQFAHHLALVVAVAALAAAGVRAASALAPRGLERFVAAAVLAAAAAALEAMGLGLVGLGSSPVALTLAAVATWVLARERISAPELTVRDELAAAWASRSGAERVAFGALAGFAVAYVAWCFRYPFVGEDGVKYHWAIVVAWVHNGHPGAATPIDANIPFDAYPLANEVLLAWGAGISRSWVAATLWTPASLALAGSAAWLALARLRAGTLVAWLGAAALVSLPICVAQLNGPPNDVPALAWLACTGALAICAAERPALLVAALVAAGLAIGTKTTTAPLALGALAISGWRARGSLVGFGDRLAFAGVAALLLAGPWYVRNLFDHGSPLWPFARGPFGDALPPLYEHLKASFLSHPGTMLDGRTAGYARVLGGGLVLLIAALVAPFVARRRTVAAAGGVVAVALLFWANAPFTGIDTDVLALAALRYLLPGLAASVFALGIVAGGGSERSRLLVAMVFALALGVSLARDFALGFPSTPGFLTLLAGLGIGALAVGVAEVAFGSRSSVRFGLPVAAVLGLVVAGGLTRAADGYVERHARTKLFDARVLAYLNSRPGFKDGSQPVDSFPVTLASLTGDRLQHRLRVVLPRRHCADPRRLFVIRVRGAAVGGPVSRCLITERPLYTDNVFAVYGPP